MTELERYWDHFELLELEAFSKVLNKYHQEFSGMKYEDVMFRVESRHKLLMELLKEDKK